MWTALGLRDDLCCDDVAALCDPESAASFLRGLREAYARPTADDVLEDVPSASLEQKKHSRLQMSHLDPALLR